MKKIQILSFIFLLAACCVLQEKRVKAEEQWPQPPEIGADAAIVMEVDSGAVLYEKNIHNQYYPASITKIMTTLLAIENCSLSDIVTFSNDSVYNVEGSQVGINPGEQLTLNQCLHGVMLASANEIAYAVGEHVGGGDLAKFVDMMNERAASLGCTDTHFNNPHGLPDENHYTSAYDMALIARAAFKNEAFRTICGTKYYTIPPTNSWPEERGVTNHHKMLTNSSYHYEYCVGGKTGYTNSARYTLVTYARKDDMTLLCVILHDDEMYAQYVDTTNLFNYCFQNFKKVALSKTDLGLNFNSNGFFPLEHTPFILQESKIILDETATLVMPNAIDTSALTFSVSYDGLSENTVAEIQYNYNGHLLGNVPILYEEPENAEGVLQTTTAPSVTESKSFFRINLRIIVYVILCIAALALIIFIIVRLITRRDARLEFMLDLSGKKKRWK